MTSSPKKIQIIGSSGSGKTTLAKKIAKKYDIEYFDMDALFWRENWQMPEKEEFVSLMKDKLESAPNGWVVDGTYRFMLGDLVTSQADTVIGLKIPMWVCIPRILRRSFGRIARKELLWGKCRETPKTVIQMCIMTATTQKRRIKSIDEFAAREELEVRVFTRNKQANDWLHSQ